MKETITTADQSITSSKKFDDPSDYIYEIYKSISEKKAKEFAQYRQNWKNSQEFTQKFDFPLYILTELTFSCNYRCPQCVLGDKEETAKLQPSIPEMPFELYKKIIDEGEKYGCKSLCMNHTNEPLLVKDLPERIRYARDHGFIDILMNTNGELLSEEKSKNIIEAGLTRLMVSIDAFTEETFKKIRVGGNFQKVKQNILSFTRIRNELGLKLPLVRTSFVLQKNNEKELTSFKKFWEDKVDYVHIQSFSKPYNTAEDSWTSRKIYSPDVFKCDQPNNRIVIRSDGEVLPCCSWFSYEIPVGNINNSSIYEIWNASKMSNLREMHFKGEYYLNPSCKKCVNSF